MTSPSRIEPGRITKPMQLLAAWLVGLIIVDSSFLIAAAQMAPVGWEQGALVIAAIGNVPLFLFALFVLQTRFRPELQEDSYYSQYLDRRTNEVVTVRRDEVWEKEITAIRSELRLLAAASVESPSQAHLEPTPKALKVGLNSYLPDFDVLRAQLKAAGVPLHDVFGSKEAPESRAFAFAERVPFEEVVRFLKMAIDMNFSGYVYIEPEEEIEEDVLIGSYGDVAFSITPALGEILNNDPEPADLRIYEIAHRRATE